MASYQCLILGDSHIPRRIQNVSDHIFQKLKEMAAIKRFTYTFFTGDLIEYDELIYFLNSITEEELFRVLGNMDKYYSTNTHTPKFSKIDIKMSDSDTDPDLLRIGLTHGSQIVPRGDHNQLELFALEHNCNILISGHTHKEEIHITDSGILLLNPGSVTGAWSFVASRTPSFITLGIDSNNKTLDVFLFQFNKKWNISRTNYSYSFQINKIAKR